MWRVAWGSLTACCLGLCIADLLIVLVVLLPRCNICLLFCYVVLRLCGLTLICFCLLSAGCVDCTTVVLTVELWFWFMLLGLTALCLFAVRHYVLVWWFW